MVNTFLQSEVMYDIYLNKLPNIWICSYFCLQRFSSIFELTVYRFDIIVIIAVVNKQKQIFC